MEETKPAKTEKPQELPSAPEKMRCPVCGWRRKNILVHIQWRHPEYVAKLLSGSRETTSVQTKLDEQLRAQPVEAIPEKRVRILKPESWEMFKVKDNIEQYHPQGSEYQQAKLCIELGYPVLLMGPKGVGKSLLTANLARELDVPRFVVNCSASTTGDDLIGSFVDFGTFAPGPVTQACLCAIETGRAMLVLEEVNGMSPGVALGLHSLLDWNKTLTLPTGQTLRVNDGAQLIVLATCNPGYAGTMVLNEAFRSRFVEIHIPEPKKPFIVKIAKKFGMDEETSIAAANIIIALREAVIRNELSFAPSIRELGVLAKLLTKTTFDQAVEIAFLGRYDGSDLDVAKNLVASAVGRTK
ncbi:MAG: AAA family ATPase [Candidatus Bathyarchaeia archaeon]